MSALLTQIGFASAFPAHALLFLLMFTSSTKVLKPYIRVLFFNSLVDLFYAFLSLVFNADHVFAMTDKGLMYFILINGLVKYPSKTATFILMGLNQFAIYWSISAVPVNFAYRYFLICRNKQIGWLSFLGLVLLSLVGPGIVVVYEMKLFWPKQDDDDFDKYFEDTSSKKVVFVVSKEFGDSRAISVITLIAIVPSCIYYAFIVVTTLLIMRRLSYMQNTKKTRMIQREMTIVLVVQAVLPFLGFLVPLTIIYIGMIFKIEMPNVTAFSKSSVAAPFFNALFTIVVIGPYQKAVVGLFCNIIKRDSVVSTTAEPSGVVTVLPPRNVTRVA